MVPMSRRYTVVPDAGRIGVLSSSERLPPSAALVRAMRFDLAGPRIAGRHHQAGLADGGDRFIGRDLILVQLVGIESDDDGSLVSAEGRRGGDAGKSREEAAGRD